MNLPRTQEQILRQIESRKSSDPLGFEVPHLIIALDFDHASANNFLNPEVTKETWTQTTLEEVNKEAKEYLSFWKEKIDNQRGISVERAKYHFHAWKWLLGHSDAQSFIEMEGGYYQGDAYYYIEQQINSGEWDKLTNAAFERISTPKSNS